MREPRGMWLALCVAALVFTLAVWAIAKATLTLMTRLGVDPMAVLLWFGLAERPIQHPRATRKRLGELFDDSAFTSPR